MSLIGLCSDSSPWAGIPDVSVTAPCLGFCVIHATSAASCDRQLSPSGRLAPLGFFVSAETSTTVERTFACGLVNKSVTVEGNTVMSTKELQFTVRVNTVMSDEDLKLIGCPWETQGALYRATDTRAKREAYDRVVRAKTTGSNPLRRLFDTLFSKDKARRVYFSLPPG